MEPGIYHGMPFEEYCAAPGVNASLLHLLERSPAHAKASMSEKQDESEKKKCLQIGTLVHRFALEPTDAALGIVVKPEGLDFRSKSGKEWRDEQIKNGLTIITIEERRNICGMVQALLDHPVSSRLLDGSKTEVSMFAPWSLGGDAMRKGRVDIMPPGNVIPDIKTTFDASPKSFEKDIWSYRYHMKAAYYLDLANYHGLEKEVFVFLAVEKEPPYAVAAYQLDSEAIKRGRLKYTDLLTRYIECEAENRWPAYSDELQMITLPKWAWGKDE